LNPSDTRGIRIERDGAFLAFLEISLSLRAVIICRNSFFHHEFVFSLFAQERTEEKRNKTSRKLNKNYFNFFFRFIIRRKREAMTYNNLFWGFQFFL